MGHWGCGIWDSDQAQDYKYNIEHDMARGKTIYEISWGDEDECLALAEMQAGTGKIHSFLKKCAYEIIDREIKEIDEGTSPWNEPEERENVLFELQGHISDCAETSIHVEKELVDMLLKGSSLTEATRELWNKLSEDCEADYIDLARLQIKSGKIEQKLKDTACFILTKWIERYKHNAHKYYVRDEYIELKKELEKLKVY